VEHHDTADKIKKIQEQEKKKHKEKSAAERYYEKLEKEKKYLAE
jgi:hypothetical protein